jgi:leader peptidase (prepilin peptidase)/N-methyltransferase
VNVILAIPFALRLILLFLVGAVLGSLVNLVVDRQREETPRYSPWNAVLDRLLGRKAANTTTRKPADERAQRRAARHRKIKAARPPGKFALLPIVGWFEVAATAPADRPRGFWVRPFLVELLFASAIMLLYWLEVGRWAFIPYLPEDFHVPPEYPSKIGSLPGPLVSVLHVQFVAHAIFLTFMLAASLIDLDEWIIPDAIAITGALVALGIALASPWSHLFNLVDSNIDLGHLHLASPGGYPAGLGARYPGGLLLGLGCVWLWCFGQLPRVWTVRWGWGTAVKLFIRRLLREGDATLRILLIGVVLTILCTLVWWYGDIRWTSLLTALVGLTVGSGILWTIRIVCSAILRREAMGFGDVTLMAMIGAFLGWQPTLFAFFVSPFFGLIPPVVALRMRSGTPRAVPFGPFLCLGAATVLLLWAEIWPWLSDRLEKLDGLGIGFAFGMLGGALVLLVAVTFGVQLVVKRRLA